MRLKRSHFGSRISHVSEHSQVSASRNETTNRWFQRVRDFCVDKLDLLFTVHFSFLKT